MKEGAVQRGGGRGGTARERASERCGAGRQLPRHLPSHVVVVSFPGGTALLCAVWSTAPHRAISLTKSTLHRGGFLASVRKYEVSAGE